MGLSTASDELITEIVATYIRLSDAAFDEDVKDEETHRLLSKANGVANKLPDLSADTVVGIKEKTRWLSLEENFNGGHLDADSVTGRVLVSLFSDIERLA